MQTDHEKQASLSKHNFGVFSSRSNILITVTGPLGIKASLHNK